MASYPTSVWAPATKNTNDVIQAAHINDAQSEIVAIESGLLNGTAPMNSSNSTVASLSVTGGSTFTGSIVASSNLSVTGNSTLVGGLSLAGIQSVTLSTGNTDNLAIGSSVSVVRLSGNSSGSTLTGIATAAGAARWITILNVSANTIVLADRTGSASSNQFVTPRLAGSTLAGNTGLDIWYDTVQSFWRVKGL